jgi:hypothetical protein
MARRQKTGEKEKLNSVARDIDVSILATYLLKIWVTAGAIKQARAFGSELLKARDLQRQLQTSMRKPLKWLTYSFKYDCWFNAKDSIGLGDMAISKARL